MNTASAGGLALAPDQHHNIHSNPRDRSGSSTESSALRSSWAGPTAAGKPYAMRYARELRLRAIPRLPGHNDAIVARKFLGYHKVFSGGTG